MPYNRVAELPASVRAKLKGKKLRQWLHVFNSAFERNKSESIAFAEAWATVKKVANFVGKATKMTDFQFFMPIAKVDKEKRTVSGYASTPTKDSDGEIVTLDAIRSALPDYMTYGNIREMHALKAVGVAQEANMDTKGLFLTAKIVDDGAWKKCLEGVYKGFSIGGKKLAKQGNKITEIEMTEVSVVDRPANPDCRISLAKSVKDLGEESGYLVKVKQKPSPEAKALAKMAKIVEGLAKAGPPAAHDGFSLPAKMTAEKPDGVASVNDSRPNENVTRKTEDDSTPCKAHGVIGCEKCAVEKRDFDAAQRREAADTGAAMPDGSFPIKNGEDLKNAVRLAGHAKEPAKAKAHIKSRAKALGLTSTLPKNWGDGKQAKKLAKLLAKAQLGSVLTLRPAVTDNGLGFLTLRKKQEVIYDELDETPRPLKKVVDTATATKTTQVLGEDWDMNKVEATISSGDPLQDAIAELMKKAAMPTRAQMCKAASDEVDKARKAMKECRKAVEAVHKMHKAAYIAKMAKAKGGDGAKDSDGEFDHAGAMGKLQKAYEEAQKARTFGKAAVSKLAKAEGMSGRSGQKGQEVGDGNAHYQVPPGVKDLSPSDLATAGPGGDSSGSSPPVYPVDGGVYPGKAAQGGDLQKFVKNGVISADVAELIMKQAKTEGELEALRRLPTSAVRGRQPFTFDTTKLMGGTSVPNVSDLNKTLFNGVNTNALNGADEREHVEASAKVIGNFLTSGRFGKSVFDPSFKGSAGGGH